MSVRWGADPLWVHDLLKRLKEFVTTQDPPVYPASAVWVYFGDPRDFCGAPQREQFLTLAPATLTPHQPTVDGGGNDQPRFDGIFTLTQFARLHLDRERQDSALMENRSLGLGEAVRKLIATLQMYDADVGGITPLVEPGRLHGPVRFNARQPPAGWAMVESTWELKFKADLTIEE